MYIVWIRIDETLPWVELKGTYETRSEAKEAARKLLNGLEMKFVRMPEAKKTANVLVPITASRRRT